MFGILPNGGTEMSVRSGGRQILMHGIVLILVGLLWGVVVPSTPYPRLALGRTSNLRRTGCC